MYAVSTTSTIKLELISVLFFVRWDKAKGGRRRRKGERERERERLVKGIMMKRGSASLLLLFVVLVLFSLSGQSEARRFRGNRGRGAVVAARSEVPLSIVTETKCDKANGVKTATRSSSTGNGRTYNAIQTQVS